MKYARRAFGIAAASLSVLAPLADDMTCGNWTTEGDERAAADRQGVFIGAIFEYPELPPLPDAITRYW